MKRTMLALGLALSGLLASSGSAKAANLTLSWMDTATEDGYKIERKAPGGNYGQIAVVGRDVTLYTDASVDENITGVYCYRVRAYNTAGNSGYSNEACLSVKLAPNAPMSLTLR